MAKVSFSQATAEPVAVEAEVLPFDKQEVSLAVAPQSQTALAVKSDSPEDFSGTVDRSDVRLPRLHLVSKTSDLATTFSPGSFVLNKEALISDGKTPLTVVCNRLKKSYQLYVDFDDPERDEKRKVVGTIEEVKALGGIISNAKEENCWSPLADIELLIKKPEGVSEEADPQFYVSAGGAEWAHVAYTVASSAYTAVAVQLITARTSGHLKATGFKGGLWHLTSKMATSGRFSWICPVLRTAGATTPEFQADLETL